MNHRLNFDAKHWRLICLDAHWIAEHYPSYGTHQVKSQADVLQTALHIGLDAMKDEIIQHQTLEWIIRERNDENED